MRHHSPFEESAKLIVVDLYNPISARKVIAPAATVLFAPKSHSEANYANIPTNIPSGTHYVDVTPPAPNSIVLMAQPAGQSCAVLGGIMALRMKTRGASAIVVGGRIRDLGEMRQLGIPVWAAATSTVGAGAEAKPWAVEVPIQLGGVTVSPVSLRLDSAIFLLSSETNHAQGDIVCADPDEVGVVVIPHDKVDEVLELCPKLTAADDKVIEDVGKGGSVQEAFKKHRSNI